MLPRKDGEFDHEYLVRLHDDLSEALNLLEDVLNGGVCEAGAAWPGPAHALVKRYEGQF